eukprot:CAMPEP_0178581318 /NCGR_PEP_ID=MMETSP0697-20121206/23106_1 /TAXON_ID=265572 /ORGANISM="Extubocellulus spinifer, Strain CCMP396" /LENGTH=34 /DNA_ID= /DNA_START= /DNA_END= /DNA_ORIENTATION=
MTAHPAKDMKTPAMRRMAGGSQPNIMHIAAVMMG